MNTIRKKLKQKKTMILMFLGIIATVLGWVEGQFTLLQAALAILGWLGVITYKSGSNRQEDLLKVIAKVTRSAGILLVLSAPPLMAGCPSAGIHDEIVELNKLHKTYRSMVIPRPGLSPYNIVKVKNLGAGLDRQFETLEKLTK